MFSISKRLYKCAMIIVALCISSVQSQTCQYLEQTDEARLLNPCVYVVDYAYYLPSGKTAEYLRETVNAKLNNSALLELPTSCTSALVRYACSLVYYKCLPEFVSAGKKSKVIYYNDTSLSVYLPIERPCVSVCTDVQTYCSSSGLYRATESYPNCFAKYNFASLPATYPEPYQFDLKNNASECYTPNFTTNAFITETYIRNGTESPCAGIVDEFINPPGTRINSSYTTLQLPYVYQDTVNSALKKVADNLPPWISNDCRLAALTYFCYRFFFKPEGITVGQALTQTFSTSSFTTTQQALIRAGASSTYPGLLTSTLYFPSYANRSFCSSYADTCADFLSVANKSALEPNCSLTSYGYDVFPDGTNQTAYSLAVKVSVYTLTLEFTTEPNYVGYYNDSEYNYAHYSPTCPEFYVIPEHPDGKEVTKVSGSVCAVGCQRALWTKSEWDYYTRFFRETSAISLALGLLLMVFVVVMQDWKRSYLIFLFTVMITMISASYVHLFTITSFEDRFCYDNAQGYSEQTDAMAPCTQVAVLSTYLFLCAMMVMFVLSVHRILLLQGDKEYIINYIAYIPMQMAVIFLPPIIPTVYGAVNKYYGFQGSQPWCFFRSYPLISQNKDVFWLGWPVLVVAFFTYGLLAAYEIVFMLQRVQRGVRRGSHNKVVILNEAEVSSPTDDTGAVVEMVVKNDDDESNAALGTNSPPVEVSVHPPAANKAKPPRTPPVEVVHLVTLIGGLVVAIIFIASRVQVYTFAKPYVDSFTDYTKCVFKNYDGTSSYLDDCGDHPAFRPYKINVTSMIVGVFCGNIIVVPAYFVGCLLNYLFAPKDAVIIATSTRVADESSHDNA